MQLVTWICHLSHLLRFNLCIHIHSIVLSWPLLVLLLHLYFGRCLLCLILIIRLFNSIFLMYLWRHLLLQRAISCLFRWNRHSTESTCSLLLIAQLLLLIPLERNRIFWFIRVDWLKDDIVLIHCVKLCNYLSLSLLHNLRLKAVFTLGLAVVLFEHWFTIFHYCVVLHVFNETPTEFFSFIYHAS
mgnify:CR=1 FL=1